MPGGLCVLSLRRALDVAGPRYAASELGLLRSFFDFACLSRSSDFVVDGWALRSRPPVAKAYGRRAGQDNTTAVNYEVLFDSGSALRSKSGVYKLNRTAGRPECRFDLRPPRPFEAQGKQPSAER